MFLLIFSDILSSTPDCQLRPFLFPFFHLILKFDVKSSLGLIFMNVILSDF